MDGKQRLDIIASRFKKLRMENGLSQKQMAEIAGITDRNYRRYEAGLVDPSTSISASFADYFDIPLDYLVGHGVFLHWEALMEQQALLESIFQEYRFSLIPSRVNEKDLMVLLPAMFARIEYDSETNSFHFFPRFPRLDLK